MERTTISVFVQFLIQNIYIQIIENEYLYYLMEEVIKLTINHQLLRCNLNGK